MITISSSGKYKRFVHLLASEDQEKFNDSSKRYAVS